MTLETALETITPDELKNFWTMFFETTVKTDPVLCELEITTNTSIPMMHKAYIKKPLPTTLSSLLSTYWIEFDKFFDNTKNKEIVFFENQTISIEKVETLVITLNF